MSKLSHNVPLILLMCILINILIVDKRTSEIPHHFTFAAKDTIYYATMAMLVLSRIKVAQNSFQHFPRRRF